ncbi:hypothetical protein FRC02_004610 [Tulasnella sp. 418]|nr:hypothetical protein FRC02_004610 [Tulasnella sp. 418]
MIKPVNMINDSRVRLSTPDPAPALFGTRWQGAMVASPKSGGITYVWGDSARRDLWRLSGNHQAEAYAIMSFAPMPRQPSVVLTPAELSLFTPLMPESKRTMSLI